MKKVLLLGFALLLFIACTDECDPADPPVQMGVYDEDTGEYHYEPIDPGLIPELPDDLIRDVIRPAAYLFHFETVTDLGLFLKVLDVYGTGMKAVISLEDEYGNLLYRGATSGDGLLNDTITFTIAAVGVTTLRIHVDGQETRTIIVHNVEELIKLDRVLYSPEPLSTDIDFDGDNVPNEVDHFPNDSSLAFAINYPPRGKYTITYEDLYPNLGDYDMNDFIAKYSFTEYKNGNNELVKVSGEVEAIARGAGYNHDFFLRIGGAENAAAKITYFDYEKTQISSTSVRSTAGALNIPIFASTKDSFEELTSAYENVFSDEPHERGYITKFFVNFNTPQPSMEVESPPYDPWLKVHNTDQHIHMPYKGNYEPDSPTYLDENGYPWAFLIPVDWQYPLERIDIRDAYPFFRDWVENDGNINTAWYFEPDPTMVYNQ